MEISDLYGDFKGAVEVELHVFSVASLSGYGCCIYIRYCYNYGYTKSLVFSQSRAPLIKTKTIHRSELQAAFLLAKSMKNVYEILVPIIPINFLCFLDSFYHSAILDQKHVEKIGTMY